MKKSFALLAVLAMAAASAFATQPSPATAEAIVIAGKPAPTTPPIPPTDPNPYPECMDHSRQPAGATAATPDCWDPNV